MVRTHKRTLSTVVSDARKRGLTRRPRQACTACLRRDTDLGADGRCTDRATCEIIAPPLFPTL